MRFLRLLQQRQSAVGLALCALALAALLAVPVAHGAGPGCFNDTAASRAKGTVALDPGHGGGDGGAENKTYGLKEAEQTLNIALRAKDVIVAQGYRVCLTRTDGSTNPGNSERGQYANSVGAKVLVLIHLNSSTNTSVNYTKTYWGKKNKDLAFSQAINRALYPALAYNVTNGGVGQFASGALLKSTMPATLAETVFISNNQEAARLADPSGWRQQQIAQALANGVLGWVAGS
jgi:N-acetylmuramoyl-L-alanine amidase